MADRGAFLSQLQQLLGKWSDWAADLESQLQADVVEPAKAALEARAQRVRELLRQGHAQYERVSLIGDDAWDGSATDEEQSWNALQDSAATISAEPTPTAKPKRAPKPRAPKPASAPAPVVEAPAPAAPVAKAAPAKKKPVAKKSKPKAKPKAKKAPARKSAVKAKKGGKKKASKKAAKKAPRKAGKKSARKPAKKKAARKKK